MPVDRQGARDRSALQDARAARRLRRRADGAAALRRAAAARQGVRRPRQGAAGRADRAGAAGLGRERQRHPAAAEGAAPRGAVRRTARRERLKLENAKSAAYVLKTLYSPHGGKLSIVRVLAGEFGEGTDRAGRQVRGARGGGLLAAGPGGQEARRPRRPARRWRSAGSRRSTRARRCRPRRPAARRSRRPSRREPVYGVAIGVKDRKDEVKLTGALARLMEEDPSLRLEHAKDTHQMVLWGQGEMHLRVALERLKRKYGVEASSQAAPAALQGDHQEGHRDPRPAQEAVGRPRPVRRRGARHQAAAARLGLPVRREDHGRRGAALSSSRRSRSAWRTSCSTARSAASRWSTWR